LVEQRAGPVLENVPNDLLASGAAEGGAGKHGFEVRIGGKHTVDQRAQLLDDRLFLPRLGGGIQERLRINARDAPGAGIRDDSFVAHWKLVRCQ
jgi:hypothetical protein